MIPDEALRETYGPHLMALAFVADARFETHAGPHAGLVVVLRTPRGPVRLRVEWKASHLSRTGVQARLSQLGSEARDWILLAPHIGRPIGQLLREAGLNYVDASGNCFVALGDDYAATVEGRRPAKTNRPRGVRAAGARVLLALLTEERLLSASLRAIGEAAGASHQAALDAVGRLQHAGEIRRDGRRRAWLPGGRRSAFARWLGEYDTALRPWLDLGRYRTPEQTPEAIEVLLARPMASGTCWLGGLAAGYRLVEHHRGHGTVAHVRGGARAFAQEIRALRDPDGELTLLKVPCELATKGAVEGTIHPLLVYAEMVQTRDERVLEAASAVRRRFLPEFA
jgi:hypothetical protein